MSYKAITFVIISVPTEFMREKNLTYRKKIDYVNLWIRPDSLKNNQLNQRNEAAYFWQFLKYEAYKWRALCNQMTSHTISVLLENFILHEILHTIWLY
jgi:hypothetical protein